MSKTLWITLSIIGLLLLGGVVYFAISGTQQSAFSRTHSDASCGNNMYTQSYSLVSQDDKSYTYQLIVIPNCVVSASDGDVGLWARENFGFIINDLPSDIQKGTGFPGQVDFVGLGVTKYAGLPNQAKMDISPTYWTASKTVTCTAGETGGNAVAQYGGTGMYASYSGVGIGCSTTLSISTALADTSYLSMGGIEKIIIDVRIPKNGIECLDNSYCSSGLSCKNSLCVMDIKDPIIPQASGWSKFTSFLKSVVDSFLSLFRSQSIVGNALVTPGTNETYNINMQTTTPDSISSDGLMSVQFANWVLSDSSNNKISEGQWERVYGSYNKVVKLQVPTDSNKDFVIVGMITQTNGTYNYNTGLWSWSDETPILHEEINVKTKYSIVDPTIPQASGWGKFWASVFGWFSHLFGG